LMEGAIPFCTSSSFQFHQTQTVRFVGRLQSIQNGMLILNTFSGEQVPVHFTNYPVDENELLNDPRGPHCLEIIGKVGSDGSLREQLRTDFGSEFDLQNWEDLVNLAQQHPDIF